MMKVIMLGFEVSGKYHKIRGSHPPLPESKCPSCVAVTAVFWGFFLLQRPFNYGFTGEKLSYWDTGGWGWISET